MVEILYIGEKKKSMTLNIVEPPALKNIYLLMKIKLNCPLFIWNTPSAHHLDVGF